MIVAPCTSDGQAHQSTRHDVNLVIDIVVSVVELPTNGQEAECRQPPFFTSQFHLIRRKLLHHKAVVRQVLIQRLDHIIPVGVRVRITSVTIERVATSIRVSRHIKPMSAPTFTISGRREKTIDPPFKGIGASVSDELLNLIIAWRNSQKIELKSANQPVGSDVA